MARRWWTLLAVCVGTLMLLLDLTVVSVALPSIARDLNASFSDLQWVIDAYALSLASLLLVAGSLGDLLGHKRVFAAGLAAFTASSLCCGLAPDSLFLILSRAAQGVGGAAMMASSLALLGHEFRGRERGLALGLYGATLGAAGAIGPVVGGALTSGINWRWIFFVNLPIGAAAFAIVLGKVAETRRRRVRPDLLGAVVFSAALFALIYGLIRGSPDGWTNSKVLSAFAVGGALLLVFLSLQLRTRDPMLELRLFRRPALTGATLAALSLSAAVFGTFLYVTLYLQNILHYSSFQAGVRLLPLSLMAFLVAPISGKLLERRRVPLRLLLGIGLVLAGAGIALMTRVSPGSNWTALLPGLIVTGAGVGTGSPALAAAAIGTVPPEKQGIGSGINTTARQVGVAAGIAALGAIFQTRLQHVLDSQLARALPQLDGRRATIVRQSTSGDTARSIQALPAQLRPAFIQAFRVAFVHSLDTILWVGAATAFAGAILTLLLIRQKDIETAVDAEDDLIANENDAAASPLARDDAPTPEKTGHTPRRTPATTRETNTRSR